MSATLLWEQADGATTGAGHTDALVICKDDDLLIELGSLLGDHYRVHAVDSPESIGGEIDIARWVGIVDVDSQAGARGVVSRLEVQHPNCPLIVVTARPEEWVHSVRRGAILAAIGRDEVATPLLSEALSAAEDRLRTDGVDELGPTLVRLDRFDSSPLRRGAIWAGAAVLLIGIGIGAGVGLHHRFGAAVPALRFTRSGSVPVATFRADRPSASRQQQVTELLSAARVAFREQRLLPPPDGAVRGESALALYVQVLNRDPQNDEALDGVRRLLALGRNRITTDAASGKFDDASRLLAVFQTAGVDAADLQQLTGAISAARPKWLAQRAAQNIAAGDFTTGEQLLTDAIASGADAATVKTLRTQETAKKLELQLTAMATQVKDAIQTGALLQPATDNARTRLAAMRSIGRYHPLTLQAEQEVQTALVQAGEQATRLAQFDLAQRNLNAAAELGSFAPLSDARRLLQQARDGAEHAPAAAVAPHTQGSAAHATLVADGGAAAAPTPPLPYIYARPTRELPVDYPANADGNGSVILEFTLSANGSASRVTVVHSDRPGVFDRAAISAVQRGRYSTDELTNGRPARARIKLSFNLAADDRWLHP